MQLWTWQEPDFSLTSGGVDLTKSEYHRTVPGAPEAYAELATRLNTNQIIWCYVHRNEYHPLPHLTRVEWALDVPNDSILAITDGFIWNKILGIRTHPQVLFSQWVDEAPMDKTDRDNYVAQKINDYHSQPVPNGGWWSQLFITDTTIEGVTVLLKHPIAEAWVVRDGRNAD